MEKFSRLLLEKDTYDYGCLMCQLQLDNINYRNGFKPFKINKEHVYNDPDGSDHFGIENEPHITILYGLHSNKIKDEDLFKWIQSNVTQHIDLSLSNVSIFENDNVPYDVVKWDINSDSLNELNSKLCKTFPYTTDFPDYHPHATIMYVNKGEGEKYLYTPTNSMNLSSDILKYSKPNGQKLYYQIK